MKHKIAVGIILILIFIVCVGIGIYIFKLNEISGVKVEHVTEIANEKITDECTEEAMELAEVNAIEKKVSPNAVFIYKIEYQKCGHAKKKYEMAPQIVVNKTENEIREMYSDWKLEGFSNNEVVLSKKEKGICDEHYVIREEEGQIVVKQLDEEGNEKIIERTGIIVQYLPEIDKENVKKGIFINGNEALNRVLEDFE